MPAPMRFRAVGEKNGLVQRVVAEIQRQIVNGRLDIGAKLPAERELSAKIGVSRPVLREAVRILVARGLLETRHGVGTTVRHVTKESLVAPLDLFLQCRREHISIAHLHQVRQMLEVENAGVAAANRSAADIERLEALVARMAESKHDPRAFADADTKFHRTIAELTHNPLLKLLLDSMQDLMAEVRHRVSQHGKLYDRVAPGHREILAAIREGDAAWAQRAMRDHLAIALTIQQEILTDRSRS